MTRRSPSRAARLVVAWLVVGAAVPGAVARSADSGWWSELPPMPPPADTLTAPRWYDAVDVAAGLSATSGAGSRVADLSLRLRLDVEAYLARVAAERADLARLEGALARQRATAEQLAWLARRCEGAWRAWQVQLLDGVLAEAPGDAVEAGYLASLRALLAIDATRPAAVSDIAACRLPGVLERLALARDHPALAIEAASRSLSDRTAIAMASPAPASAWLHVELAGDVHGPRAAIRAGLDVPIPVGTGGIDLTLRGDAQGASARVAWQRSGMAAAAGWSRRSTAADPSAGRGGDALGDAFHRRRLEAILLVREAERSWDLACAAIEPRAIVECLAAASSDAGGGRADGGLVDALLRAIDAELSALRTLLAAIEAAGHGLETLVLER
jgi:hypothetical protein